MSASGMLRCGSLISPPTSARLFHPLYAHSAPIIAAPNPPRPPRAAGPTPSQDSPAPVIAKCAQSPGANISALTPTASTSTILMPVNTAATLPLVDTVAQLIKVTIAMQASDTACKGPKDI